jgi:hypothetical protein
MSTTAERLAALADDNGCTWRLADGGDFLGRLETEAFRVSTSPDGCCTRYEFDDTSAIVVVVSGWDLGFSGSDLDCWCWPEMDSGRHSEDCQYKD